MKHAWPFGKILLVRRSPGQATCSGRTGRTAARRGRRACLSCGRPRTRRRPAWPARSGGATRRPGSLPRRSRPRGPPAGRRPKRCPPARGAPEAPARSQKADTAAAEVSGRLGRLAGAARGARDEADRLDAAIEAAGRAAEKDLARLEQLRKELLDAEAEGDEPDEPPEEVSGRREDLADRCTEARNAEMEARLEVRTAEERLRAIAGRADS